MTLTDGMESEFMEAKMSRLNDEILQIKQMIKRQEHETKMQQAKGDKTRDLLAIITDRDFQIAEYSDMLVTRIIEQITVLSAEKFVFDLSMDIQKNNGYKTISYRYGMPKLGDLIFLAY